MLPSSQRSLKRPTDNSQSPEQGGGSRRRRNFKGPIPRPSIHLWSAPRVPFRPVCLPCKRFYAAALPDASAAVGRSAFFRVAFGKAWRNGSYTSPLTQRQCSNTAFYEKVLNVKADVAAILNSFFPAAVVSAPIRASAAETPVSPIPGVRADCGCVDG